MTETYAHSGRRGIPPQTYRNHIWGDPGNPGVLGRALCRLNAMLAHSADDDCDTMRAALAAAAEYHDLGKLDDENQNVLGGSDPTLALPVSPHEDAASAHLCSEKLAVAQLLAFSHHGGLPDVRAESAHTGFRDARLRSRTNALLSHYLRKHQDASPHSPQDSSTGSPKLRGLGYRLLLSCLVDADHGNTARHFGQEATREPTATRWKDRLDALDRYVAGLDGDGSASGRNALRGDIYQTCRHLSSRAKLLCCASPVGTGKTTAVMAHLLRVAAERSLRHVYVVLPYTNVIDQSVDVYRRALCLPGEDPAEVVLAHHHKADFKDLDARQLASLWRSPIIVTTAVQFFETLGSNQPSRLRRLHELPGSAVFVDEAHAAMPLSLWPQQWRWIEELIAAWNCHFVMASGSLARFWTLPGFYTHGEVGDLLPTDLQRRAESLETNRIAFRRESAAWSVDDILRHVESKPGPRLVIMNTVQSAAVVADAMRRNGRPVLHLSTALTPSDRTRMIARVNRLLTFRNTYADWTLVATSCVEAGMDFSFRTAFRESASVASLLQIGGRANRNAAPGVVSEIIDFRTSQDDMLNRNPGVALSRDVLSDLFAEGWLDGSRGVLELMTEAVGREWKVSRTQEIAESLMRAEGAGAFREVASQCRIIDAETCTVLVDRTITRADLHGMNARDIQLHSVQLWVSKVQRLALQPISPSSDLYSWPYAYDPDFLGIMAGVLPLLKIGGGDLCIV